MPNYVRNKVTYDGPPEKIRQMLEEIRLDGKPLGTIDFNKIIPMPESLNIESGTRTDPAMQMYARYIKARSAGEPLDSFEAYRADHEEEWHLGRQAFENAMQYGHKTWYG